MLLNCGVGEDSCKEIKPVNPKGNPSWIFTGRTDAEAETPILWPPDMTNWLIWKDPDAWKVWRWTKGMTEYEMVGWHHLLSGQWVWVNSGCCWWRGRPVVLQSMGLQRVGHKWATEPNWTDWTPSSASLKGAMHDMTFLWFQQFILDFYISPKIYVCNYVNFRHFNTFFLLW